MKLNKCSLSKYSIDYKNSVEGEAQSRSYPGHPHEFAINIQEILIEEKTSVLKNILLGIEIQFKIDEDIEYFVPNYKNKEDDACDHPADGEGSGIITEIKDFDPTMEDEEVQEITIILKNGYAEGL